MSPSILESPIDTTPVAVIDFETTGLSPKAGARVVEVSIVRVEPDRGAQLVLDTLVNPEGPVLCSGIHGITDADVAAAPRFADLVGPIAHALRGAVVMSFNASFDMGFLADEANRTRGDRVPFWLPPHACLMYLRPALGIGARCGLHVALNEEQLPIPDHRAAHDALASAALWEVYRERAKSVGVRTFAEIRARKRYKFMDSWAQLPIDDVTAARLGSAHPTVPLHPRIVPVSYPDSLAPAWDTHEDPVLTRRRERAARVAAYQHGLVDALSDAVLTDEEVEGLRALQAELQIAPGEVRAVHAALYADVLHVAIEDQFVSHQESDNLVELGRALRSLGWGPGMRSA
jgi:DNA polymerase III epsilon subunit-like protein